LDVLQGRLRAAQDEVAKTANRTSMLGDEFNRLSGMAAQLSQEDAWGQRLVVSVANKQPP